MIVCCESFAVLWNRDATCSAKSTFYFSARFLKKNLNAYFVVYSEKLYVFPNNIITITIWSICLLSLMCWYNYRAFNIIVTVSTNWIMLQVCANQYYINNTDVVLYFHIYYVISCSLPSQSFLLTEVSLVLGQFTPKTFANEETFD